MTSRIIISQEVTEDLRSLFMKLQKDHREIVEGIYDLYDELYINGKCESYNLDRIYYVAYTLATKGIEFKVMVS